MAWITFSDLVVDWERGAEDGESGNCKNGTELLSAADHRAFAREAFESLLLKITIWLVDRTSIPASGPTDRTAKRGRRSFGLSPLRSHGTAAVDLDSSDGCDNLDNLTDIISAIEAADAESSPFPLRVCKCQCGAMLPSPGAALGLGTLVKLLNLTVRAPTVYPALVFSARKAYLAVWQQLSQVMVADKERDLKGKTKSPVEAT